MNKRQKLPKRTIRFKVIQRPLTGISEFGLLSSSEFKQLTPFFPLAERWGYRTGELGHSGYELRTHTEYLRLLQYYTDIVFRNLQQLRDQRPDSQHVVFVTDVVDHARLAENLDELKDDFGKKDNRVRDSTVTLLSEFMNQPAVRTLMTALASIDIFSNPVTICFAGIVTAASSILLMSQYNTSNLLTINNFHIAYNQMRSFYEGATAYMKNWKPDSEESRLLDEIDAKIQREEEELERQHRDEEEEQSSEGSSPTVTPPTSPFARGPSQTSGNSLQTFFIYFSCSRRVCLWEAQTTN
jgi:hypothetical protein